jgi:hypothetical protein
MLLQTGAKVQYDAHYKAIKEAYVSEDFSESAAELVLKKDFSRLNDVIHSGLDEVRHSVPTSLQIFHAVTNSHPLTKHLVGPDGELLTTVSIKHSSRNEIQVIWKADEVFGQWT